MVKKQRVSPLQIRCWRQAIRELGLWGVDFSGWSDAAIHASNRCAQLQMKFAAEHPGYFFDVNIEYCGEPILLPKDETTKTFSAEYLGMN